MAPAITNAARPRPHRTGGRGGALLRPLGVLALSASLLLGGGPAELPRAEAAGQFFDDNGSVHERAIEAAAVAGLTVGCNPPLGTRFCPQDGLTRGQLAAFLSRALSLPASSTDWFDDDAGHLFERDVNRLREAGITSGCGQPDARTFCPDAPVTRAQMAQLFVRAFELPPEDRDRFRDDDGSMFEDAIDALAASGITYGCNPPANTLFCPQHRLTREQLASFLVRAKGLKTLDPGRFHERRITYEVRSFGGPTYSDLATFRTRAGEAMYAPDGWSVGRRLLLEQVDSGGQFTLFLTDHRDISSRAAVCSPSYSCTVGTNIYINDRNFAQRPSPFANTSQEDYQRYVINHEVGHFLGFDRTADAGKKNHYNDPVWCESGTRRAPVMMQQSISTRGCRANVTPLPFELDCVEEAWLRDTTDQGAECPHTEPRR